MPKIFFDLDGTLIDSRKRLYVLFKKLVPQSMLSFDEYWEMKRNKINHKMIIEKNYPQVNFIEFEKKWLNQIESTEMLALDILYPGTEDVLVALNKEFELYALTARQSRENLYEELKKLNIYNFFENILLTEHKCAKIDLLKEFSDLTKEDILIGDTGYDIQTAKACGLRTFAISHGFLAPEILREYKPDKILHGLVEVEELINTI